MRNHVPDWFCWVVAAGLVLITQGGSWANTMTAVWVVTNFSDWNDFHVIMEASNATSANVEKNVWQNAEMVRQPDATYVAKWWNTTGYAPDWSEIGAGFTGVSEVKIKEAFWTKDGSRGDPERIPGFKKQEVGSVLYTITNNSDMPMTIRNLQFLLDQVSQVPLPLMGYGKVPGPWSSPLPDFQIAALSEASFLLPSLVGLWNLTQFEVLPPANQATVQIMHQFDVQAVPEPSTVLLLGAGLGGMLLLRKKSRKR